MISFLKKLWNGESHGLTSAALLIGGASLVSRLVGVLRDRILAGMFGAGPSLDAYYAAFRLPDALYNLLVVGALSAAFIPVFSDYLATRGKEETKELASRVLAFIGLMLALSSVLIVIFAPTIVPWMTPGFPPETMELTIHLTRIMALSPFLLGLSAVMGSILQATRRFFAFAIAPVLYNIGIIVGALFFGEQLGMIGVAWGVVIGALAHFLVQASVVISQGFIRLTLPRWNHEGVRRIAHLMVPRFAGLAVNQVNFFILLGFASSLAAGDVTVFNFASNIQSFPLGLIGISFAIAAFPLLSRAASMKDDEGFRSALEDGVRKIIFFILPAEALFLLLRAQIVRLLLGQGKFDWDDTIRTAAVLGWFSLSLIAQCLAPLLARAFYAIQNTRTPLIISLITEGLAILVAFSLKEPLGISGLAIAFSCAAILQTALLFIALRIKQNISLLTVRFRRASLHALLATGALSIVAYVLRQWIGTVYPLRTFAQVLLQTSVSAIGGMLTFFVVAALLGSPELIELKQAITRRFWKQTKLKEGMDEAQKL